MKLGLLRASGEAILGESIQGGVRSSEALAGLVEPFRRDLDLLAVTEIVDEVMRRYSPRDTVADRTAADAWLGPRLHAALRLTRAEAAIDEIWFFLAAYAFPDYVRWRWVSEQGLAVRFFSTDVKKQAFKRLWWTTELFRNGSNYCSATQALSISDVPNTITGLDAVHSRPVALGVLDFIERHGVGSRQVNDLGKQLNSSAVTVALDRAYIAQDEAIEIDQVWLSSEPDLQELMNNPIGPRHGEVEPRDVEAVYLALRHIVDLDVLRQYRQTVRPHDEESVT